MTQFRLLVASILATGFLTSGSLALESVTLKPGATYVVAETIGSKRTTIPRFCSVPDGISYHPGPKGESGTACFSKITRKVERAAAFLSFPKTAIYPDFAVRVSKGRKRVKKGTVRLERKDPDRGVFYVLEVPPGRYFPAVGATSLSSTNTLSVEGRVPFIDVKPGQVTYIGTYDPFFVTDTNPVRFNAKGLANVLETNGLDGFQGRLVTARPKAGHIDCIDRVPIVKPLKECRFKQIGGRY
ncbi:MAG: hypothetical protein AAGE89_11505 [Pseudomonadota bacterium]